MNKTSFAVYAESITKKYKDVTAADNISLGVNEGEIYGLIGPDGAGKTTMLRIIAGILKPDSGSVYVCGHSCDTEHDAVKDSIAYMSQKFGLYPDLTVWENIKFYADLYGVEKHGLKEHIEDLLDFSYMRPFKKRQAGRLSGGMKQKLQLVCALVHKPEVLLLDEPTNGVDPVSRRDFWKILYKLVADGMTIVMSTAYLDEAERCSRIGLMNAGRVIAEGSPDEVVKNSGLNMLSVRCGNCRKASATLKKEFGADRVHAFGDKFRIFSADISADRKKLTEMSADFIVTDEIPVLEDIFMSMQKDMSADDRILSRVTDDIARRSGESLKVTGLTKKFGDFTAVNSINLTVPYGEIFGFLGPNGAGKSTTIKMLCGLLPPTSGSGRVGGMDVMKDAEKIKASIGYMSQKFSLYEDLKVYENIDFYGGIYGLKNAELERRRDWALELSGLRDRKNEMTSVLVGGWRQRLALACSILHKPSIVFLDEPTSGADPASRRLFWAIINELALHGVTVFVSTHYMEEAEYCDRLALIFRGEMIAMGRPDVLKSEMMRDNIIEVKVNRPQDYIEDLTAVRGVMDVSLFGAGLHLRTEDISAEEGIAGFFRERKISADVRKVLPSMEDVFVSMIEKADPEGKNV